MTGQITATPAAPRARRRWRGTRTAAAVFIVLMAGAVRSAVGAAPAAPVAKPPAAAGEQAREARALGAGT